MCQPQLIIAAAMMGASTAMNSAAARKVQSARNEAMTAERMRQQGLDREAAAVNAQSQDRYKDFDEQQEGRASELAQFFTSQEVADPAATEAVPASSSNITVREEAKQRGAAKERTDKIGDAFGNLRAFGDLLGGISRLQGRDAATIGQIGGFKRGSSDALAYELDAAGDAGNGLKTWADIVGGLGQIGMQNGLAKGPAVTGGAATAPAANSAVNMATPNLYSMYG